jgi:2-polyprenyl-6-hydroxyphenyl methylase/3-demethylubiquinone-9 3-methyltransferase
MEETFYGAETPEDAIEIYFKGYDNFYGRLKVQNIREILRGNVKSWESLKVLEVGAGGGVYTEFFINQGAKVACIDVCKQILKGNMKLHPQAICILADATTVALNEKFDLVFAVDIIEHIEEDLLFLKNMNKHLKKEGLLVVNTQNAFSLNYLIEGGRHRLRGDKKWMGWDPTHVRFYTPSSLKEKLWSTGFEISKWFGNFHIPYILTQKIFGEALGYKVSHVAEISKMHDKLPFSITGWGIGVVAKKVRDI